MNDGRGQPSIPLTGAHLAHEFGEIAWAALIAPWGSTAADGLASGWPFPRDEAGFASSCRTPVVLVHGYGGSRATWLPVERELRQGGFGNVHTVAYNPVTATLSSIARGLWTTCHEAMEAASSDHVHLIGHSLGGVVVRYGVQRTGLAADVRTAVTVAAPHRGTPLASLGWGSLVRDLRVDSPMLRDLDRGVGAGADGVRWVAYYAECDLIVAPESARLDKPELHALNVAIPDVGHLGILRSPVFLLSVRQLLLAAEGLTQALPAAGTAAPAAA